VSKVCRKKDSVTAVAVAVAVAVAAAAIVAVVERRKLSED